jgi:hypothetical protein
MSTKPYDYRNAAKSAKPISQFVGTWKGKSPHDLDPSIDNGACEEIDMDSLIDKEVIIFGYSLRDGMNNRPFAVICLIPADSEKIFVLVNGGGVIIDKLAKVPENDFPIKTTFKKENNKQGLRYFDMI